jgi:GT2 family glycosyltransferase
LSEKFRIAVLMAVHNRWELTQEILSKISVKDSPFNLCIHIVDDGSSDVTQEKLRCDPSLNYIRVEGDLYWARSMKKAQDSVTEPVDYFLWLNNDVSLTDDFFHRILASIKLFPKSILVGQTSDPVSNLITYGGLNRIGRHPHRLKTITTHEKYESADTFCGNIVLIPSTINESLGGIDGKYEHGFADYDFGYRANKMGFDVRVIPGILGTCALNPPQLSGMSRLKSLKILRSRKYLPIRSQILFCKRHSGVTWPVYVISPYLRVFLKLKRFRSNRINAGF